MKRRAAHDLIMKKLDSRPDDLKLQMFLKYEKLNLKSHLYNQTHKTDKMFRELNAIQYKPSKIEQSVNHSFETSQQLKLYGPLLDQKRDEVSQYLEQPP